MYSHFRRMLSAVVLLASALLSLSCEQRSPQTSDVPSPGRLQQPTAMQGELRPGQSLWAARVTNPYQGDPTAVNEGRRLYNWYNCVGCHFNGGGGMGPPLMDDDWIYGSDPENVYDSIYRGRPNGMPAFGGRVPERQLWQIAAYVRTLNPNQQPEKQGRQNSSARPSGGGDSR